MSFVLLLDPDPDHAAAVVGALRGIPCKTVMLPKLCNAIPLISAQTLECVVLASASDTDWHGEVDAILAVVRELSNPPDIICLLKGPYRGPNDRIYAAQKGFVVIHE